VIVSIGKDHQDEVEVGITQRFLQFARTAIRRNASFNYLISRFRHAMHLLFEWPFHPPSAFRELQFHVLFSLLLEPA